MAAGCTPSLSGTANIEVVADPVLTNTSAAVNVCPGGTADLTATLTGGSGCTIAWNMSTDGGMTWLASGLTGLSAMATVSVETMFVPVLENCANGCNTTPATPVTVSVSSNPVVTVSGPTAVCGGSNFTLTATATPGTGTCAIEWFTSASPTGPWVTTGVTGATLMTSLASGSQSYQAVYSCTGAGCNPSSAVHTVTAGMMAATMTPTTQTICAGTSANLNLTITGSNATPYTVTYTVNNTATTTATIASSPGTLTVMPLINPSVYRITKIVDANACELNGAPTLATATVGVNQPAVINAGADQTICAGNTATITGTVNVLGSPATWSTSGTGSFSTTSLTTPSGTTIYTPSPADITAGTVTITATSKDPSGPCPAVTDVMVLTITPPFAATLSIVPGNEVVCAGQNAMLQINFSGGTAPWTVTYNVDGGNPVTATTSSNPYLITVSPLYNTNYELVSASASGSCTGTVFRYCRSDCCSNSSFICNGYKCGLFWEYNRSN